MDPGVLIEQRGYPTPQCLPLSAAVLHSRLGILAKVHDSLGKVAQLILHPRHLHLRKESARRQPQAVLILPVSQSHPPRAGSYSSDQALSRLQMVFPGPQTQLHWPMQWET